LIFGLDATASRQPTWDMASKLQGDMFAATSGLDVQLTYYRGCDECVALRWLSNPHELAGIMSTVLCKAGPTQIRRVLEHARKENAREKVNALVIVSDACEEQPGSLYDAARALGDVPVFLFQEGSVEGVTAIYREITLLTKGALASFDAGAAGRLADLLKAVATFAAGGVKARAAQKTDVATLLLAQIKK
jgi:hypothetical protein